MNFVLMNPIKTMRNLLPRLRFKWIFSFLYDGSSWYTPRATGWWCSLLGKQTQLFLFLQKSYTKLLHFKMLSVAELLELCNAISWQNGIARITFLLFFLCASVVLQLLSLQFNFPRLWSQFKVAEVQSDKHLMCQLRIDIWKKSLETQISWTSQQMTMHWTGARHYAKKWKRSF